MIWAGDLITYGIRWKKYEYSTATGAAQQATVVITDVLDKDLDFVSATLIPTTEYVRYG